jgi:aromatic ring-cleaving dioxygenase
MPGTQLQPHHQRHPDRAVAAAYIEQAYFDAKSKAHNAGWARKPIVEVRDLLDAGRHPGPAGQHVASLFCQQVNPTWTAAGTRTATPSRT